MEENSSSNSLMMGRVILAFDATKERNEQEFKNVIDEIISRGDILKRGDTIVVFGVLHKISHPFGYQMQIEKVNIRAMEEEIKLKLDMYAKMLKRSAEDCKEEGVDIEVKITCGTPIKKIIQQEASACNAAWVVLDSSMNCRNVVTLV
ncbi:concanavalin A-like lectin/glucanase [Tanacetum coccineum]